MPRFNLREKANLLAGKDEVLTGPMPVDCGGVKTIVECLLLKQMR